MFYKPFNNQSLIYENLKYIIKIKSKIRYYNGYVRCRILYSLSKRMYRYTAKYITPNLLLKMQSILRNIERSQIQINKCQNQKSLKTNILFQLNKDPIDRATDCTGLAIIEIILFERITFEVFLIGLSFLVNCFIPIKNASFIHENVHKKWHKKQCKKWHKRWFNLELHNCDFMIGNYIYTYTSKNV